MIKHIGSIEEYASFVEGLSADFSYSDPHFSHDSNNLWGAPQKNDQMILGVFREDKIIGIFVFLILKDEKYVEMIGGLSKEREAFEEALQYLAEICPGFSADFVLNPCNWAIRSVLQKHKASFEKEQQTMYSGSDGTVSDGLGIQVYSDTYRDQYLSMHHTDVYWTGEKVIASPDVFRILLAVKREEVVGYIDITHCHSVNELYDLMVKEQFLGEGYEKALLLAAIEYNRPNGLMVMVDKDDACAIALYESVGFKRSEHLDSVTAHLKI